MPEDNAEQQKPVGPFEDFEACVSHFDGDAEVDDPEALCGWMEQNQQASAVQEYTPDEDEITDLVDAMKQPEAEAVLTDLEVTFVSGVGDPAQDSQWVMAKDAAQQRGADWGVTAPLVFQKGTGIALAEDEGEAPQQKAWAPVLIPNETDKQGDVIPPEAIEKAAHTFLAEYRSIDTDHDLLEGKGTPIESWTLKEDSTFTLPDGSDSREYPRGTWMMGVEFSDEAWKRIESGDLTGFSIYGEATEHSVAELLGGGVEMDAPGVFSPQVREAAAKRDGSDTTEETMNENTPEKQMGADALAALAEAMREYFDTSGGTVEDTSLAEFFGWAADTDPAELDDTVEIGGVEIPVRPEAAEEPEGEGEAPESEPEEQQMDDNTDSGTDGGENSAKENPEGEAPEGEDAQGEADSPEVKEMLEEVRDTVTSTQKSVEDHGERLEALESEVFEKEDGEGEGEASEGEASEAPDPDEMKQEAEQAGAEAAEKQVKDLLGLDADEELPEDPAERQEVVRKHLHEQPEDSGPANPDTWSEDEVSEVVK